MERQQWQARIRDRLRNTTTLIGKMAPGMTYGALATATLLPIVDAVKGGDIMAITSLYTMLGNVGAGLITNLIQQWKDRDEAAAADELPAVITEQIANDDEAKAAFDKLINGLETVRLTLESNALPDPAAFVAALQTELAELGSSVVIAGDWVAGDKVGGDKVGGDKFTIDNIQSENVVIGPGSTQVNIGHQDIHNYPSAHAEPAFSVLQERYLHRILNRENRLSLEGIKGSTDEDVQLQLSTVYTALLTMTPEDHERWSIDNRAEQREHNLSAVALLDRHQHLVLLGDPGSGKSTFVKFVALCMAGELLGDRQVNLQLLTTPPPDEGGTTQENEAQPWGHKALLPILIVLRDFAAESLLQLSDPATAHDLLQFIERTLEKMGLADFAPHLKNLLHQGECLLLLDGLDEVPDAKQQREQLRSCITDFTDTYSECRVLVTSRTYAYQKPEWRLREFAVAVLAPFSTGQIRWFVEQWYAQDVTNRYLDQSDIEGQAEALKHAIMSNPRLYELAERPLLLTLMASLHAWNRGQLPQRRVELYEASVDLLLNQWERQRIRRGPDGEVIVLEPSLSAWLNADRDQIRRLIHRLAFEAHARQETPQGTADVPETDLVMELYRLRKNQAINETQIIHYLSDRAGILVHRAESIYSFPHRTFQEYLASCHLNYMTDNLEDIAKLTCDDPNRWREAALLAVAQLHEVSHSFWAYIEAFCQHDPAEHPYTLEEEWGAHFAGKMVVDNIDNLDELSHANQRKLAIVRKGLCSVVTGTVLPAIERAEAGRTLAKLGDPRNEVLTAAAMQFCYVPAGLFIMGSDPDADGMSRDEEQPQHEFDIEYSYWISRFPVTNAQFAEFMADEGYANPVYWTEAIAHGYWEKGAFQGEWDNEQRTQPHQYGEPFHLPNHPVIGITWYEALAYTRWLTANQVPDGWQAHLPSEAEWEKSARGGLQIPQDSLVTALASLPAVDQIALTQIDNPQPTRRYPWGEQIDPERCSFNETNLGSTSAVGAFAAGVSSYGVEEMSGSVWEWTRSVWGEDSSEPAFKYPYNKSDGREDLDSDKRKQRLLRGGSFVNDGYAARAAFRLRLNPYFRNDVVGVRLVLSPLPQESVSLSSAL